MTVSDSALALPAVNTSVAPLTHQVHKFGGSSLASVDSIRHVAKIVSDHCQLNDIVVVSANGKTTDELFSLVQLALTSQRQLDAAMSNLATKQSQLIQALLSEACAAHLLSLLKQDIRQIALWLRQDVDAHQNDLLAFGELWSARLFSALINETVCPSYALDARDFLVVNSESAAQVVKNISCEQLDLVRQTQKLAVVTGYIAKDSDANTVTLGRNGSDYSATLMSLLSGAKRVTLWTDVDGIYSADPRIVSNARKLARLPNGMARELGRLGNPILHEKTLLPLSAAITGKVTHLHVASSFDSTSTGTEIGEFSALDQQVLSFTHLNELILAYSSCFIGASGRAASLALTPVCSDQQQGLVLIHRHQQPQLDKWVASQAAEYDVIPAAMLAVVGDQVALNRQINIKFKGALKDGLNGAAALHLIKAENHHSIIAILAQSCSPELLNRVHNQVMKQDQETWQAQPCPVIAVNCELVTSGARS
jgi:aspartokinase/homoserine dehydrogenase 2